MVQRTIFGIRSTTRIEPKQQIRIVERLGEIRSRASTGISDHAEGVEARVLSATGGGATGGGAPGVWGRGDGSPSGDDIHNNTSLSTIPSGGGVDTLISMSRGRGGGQGDIGVGGVGGIGSIVGRDDITQHQGLDDTALNELGDADLEVLLEQMWMKVMGQVRKR